MSHVARDVLLLTLLALAARFVAALVVSYPPYTDPAYYALIAERLVDGQGFTTPVLWSFHEVGNRLPEDPTLPVPSNRHWMPLTSVIAAASMTFLGDSWRAGQLPMIALSAALPPMTYLVAHRLWPETGRTGALLSGLLAVFAGPLLILYPTIDNFAAFGVAGCAALYCSVRATDASRPGPWLAAAGAAAGLATLARIDGVLLTVAPATAWMVSRGWWPWRRSGDAGRRPLTGTSPSGRAAARAGYGAAMAAIGSYVAVMTPWLLRNLSVFGKPLPSAGGHTLWIRSYNEQFSIGHEVTLEKYLEWGLPNIVGSKLESWGELAGRTAVLLGGTFFLFFVAGLWLQRRRPELAPFLAYFAVMFVTMGAVFTFHAPKGAFYHSSPAWLPFAIPLGVASIAPVLTAAGRVWRFLRRPATHRFVAVAGLVGAVLLSLTTSSLMYANWEGSREQEEAAGRFFIERGLTRDVVMHTDPSSLHAVSGNPGIATPFDSYPVIERAIRAYDVRWVVVTLPEGAEIDPLGFWHGADSRDLYGNPATFLADEPAFEADGVRIYAVRRQDREGRDEAYTEAPSTIGPP